MAPPLFSYVTFLDYRPRTRPVRQTVIHETVFGSVKSVPDEWTQLIGTVDVRPRYQQQMTPVECQVSFSSLRGS